MARTGHLKLRFKNVYAKHVDIKMENCQLRKICKRWTRFGHKLTIWCGSDTRNGKVNTTLSINLTCLARRTGFLRKVSGNISNTVLGMVTCGNLVLRHGFIGCVWLEVCLWPWVQFKMCLPRKYVLLLKICRRSGKSVLLISIVS
jgi:hypothetical protein